MRGIKINQSITSRQDASLSIFFKEVSKIPMISAEEEVKLAERIKNGDKDAAKKLVEANLRFIISVAKQYQNKGLPLVDLIQSGCEGAIEASTRWDPSKGFKFISYAVWWIRQAITKFISDNSRTVRVPISQIVCVSKINKVINKLEQEYNREPAIEEIEQKLDIDSSKINSALIAINKSISLDTPFKDDDDVGCLLDIIPNKNSTDDVINTEPYYELKFILNKLSDREHDIIKMIYGIDMSQIPLKQIGQKFGLVAERVRQIQHSILNKLKSHTTLKELL